jgi:ABC-type branched-subunit amino acid transport system ATPase component
MRLFEVSGLIKTFGGLNAVDNLSLHVDEGEIVSVIGPNGAGKTTLFNLITGFYAADGGSIRFRGEELRGLPPHQITSRGVARTFQNVRLFQNMTILENVMVSQHARSGAGVIGSIFHTPKQRAEEARIQQVALEQLSFFGTRLVGYRLNQPAFVLSYANRRRLEIARAMATQADLLLLDEPAAGMNPRETAEITSLIGRLRDERGFTILVIEHDMRLVKGVSDRVIAMDYGRKISEGSYEAVTSDPLVIEAYLGRPVGQEQAADKQQGN